MQNDRFTLTGENKMKLPCLDKATGIYAVYIYMYISYTYIYTTENWFILHLKNMSD